MNRPDQVLESIQENLGKLCGAPHERLHAHLIGNLNAVWSTGKRLSYREIADALNESTKEAAQPMEQKPDPTIKPPAYVILTEGWKP